MNERYTLTVRDVYGKDLKDLEIPEGYKDEEF